MTAKKSLLERARALVENRHARTSMLAVVPLATVVTAVAPAEASPGGSGGCCLPSSGTCTPVGFPEECEMMGGLYQDSDSGDCIGVVCPETIACCFTDGATACMDTFEDLCFDMNGSPGPSGSSCVDDPCPEACCFTDGTPCTDIPPAQCMMLMGTPGGVGTYCAGGFGDPAGEFACPEACCFADGTACMDLPPNDCMGMNGFFLGPGTSCANNPCQEACCFTDGSSGCDDQVPADCTAAGGTPQGPGTACFTGSFAGCPEACCFTDGMTACMNLTFQDCNAMGGFSQGVGTSCANNPCPEACCFTDGSSGCDEQVPADCTAAGGTPQGPGTTCFDPNVECPEACCFTDGQTACMELSFTACGGMGGFSQGPGTTCANAPCREACCFTDGFSVCDEQIPADCTAAGGTPQGPGTSCLNLQCPKACCFTDGMTGCMDLAFDDCAAINGTTQGPGTTCANTECPEACCSDSGICSDELPSLCSGTSLGPGTSCSGPNAVECPQACCFTDGATPCTDLGPTECMGMGGTPQGGGTTCASTECPEACCFTDGSACMDLTPENCMKAGGSREGPGTACATIDCPEACCFEDGSCQDLTPSDCADQGGMSQGEGVFCEPGLCQQPDRATPSDKGSLLAFSAIELRWGGIGPGGPGAVLQDTFISLTNDFPEDVDVQMYLINGDPPLAADPATGERAHPGWNYLDNQITLTGDQPTYWSMLTGLPATGGVAPFTALDPGFPPGRPANDGTGDRVLRGYLVMWAVNSSNQEIRWNHLKGEATIVNYDRGCAWEYGSVNFPVVDPTIANGQPLPLPGVLKLNGFEYAQAPAMLLMNFQAAGAAAFSGPRQVISDTRLAFHPMTADLRQEGVGPVTTKANFSIWNMNEVKFSETHRCVTCWDDALLSQYGTPNSFVLQHLQTPHGKARFNGVASQVCDVDVVFDDGACGSHPDDVCSSFAPLLGVATRLLTYDGGADHGAAAVNLVGLGRDDTGLIQYDVLAPPPEGVMPKTPVEMLDWLELQFGVGR